MVKSVCMKSFSRSMFLFVQDSLEFSFKSTSQSNISIAGVNVNEGEIKSYKIKNSQHVHACSVSLITSIRCITGIET